MYKILQINLSAPKEDLIRKIKDRVAQRHLDLSFEKKETDVMAKQLVWFKKYKGGFEFDVTKDGWQIKAKECILEWYNKDQDAS